jgi:hypothetical protein
MVTKNFKNHRSKSLALAVTGVAIVVVLSSYRVYDRWTDSSSELSELARIDAEAFYNEDDLDRQRTFLEQRLELEPDAPITLASVARVYLELAKRGGDESLLARADSAAKRSLELAAHDNFAAIEILARVASYQHDFTRAVELARQLINQGKYAGYEIATSSLVAIGQLDRAKVIAQEFLDLERNVTSLLQSALVAEARADYKLAEELFKSALAAEQPNSKAATLWSRTIAARFFMRRGRLRDARAILDRVLEVDKDYPLALTVEAEIFLKEGNPLAASTRFERAALLRSVQKRCAIAEPLRKERQRFPIVSTDYANSCVLDYSD